MLDDQVKSAMEKDVAALRKGLDSIWMNTCSCFKECAVCPLWYGNMDGGCCKGLREGLVRVIAQLHNRAQHSRDTLADFIEIRIKELEDGKK